MTRPDAADEWLAEFGHAIKTAREQKGWLQRELATKLGVSRPSMANIEAGRQNIPVTVAAQLVTLLGIDLPGWDTTGDGAARARKQLLPKAEVERLRAMNRTAHENARRHLAAHH